MHHGQRLANARGGSSQGAACLGPASGARFRGRRAAGRSASGRPASCVLRLVQGGHVLGGLSGSPICRSTVQGARQAAGVRTPGVESGVGPLLPARGGPGWPKARSPCVLPDDPGDDDSGEGRVPGWQRGCQPSKRGKQLRLDRGAHPAQGDPRLATAPPGSLSEAGVSAFSPRPRRLLALGGISGRGVGSERAGRALQPGGREPGRKPAGVWGMLSLEVTSTAEPSTGRKCSLSGGPRTDPPKPAGAQA